MLPNLYRSQKRKGILQATQLKRNGLSQLSIVNVQVLLVLCFLCLKNKSKKNEAPGGSYAYGEVFRLCSSGDPTGRLGPEMTAAEQWKTLSPRDFGTFLSTQQFIQFPLFISDWGACSNYCPLAFDFEAVY